MDIGALQIPGTDTVMLFGGFTDNMIRSVPFYNTEAEGKFETFKTTELQKGDYFQVNGSFIQSNGMLILAGQNTCHKFDLQTRTFTEAQMQMQL